MQGEALRGFQPLRLPGQRDKSLWNPIFRLRAGKEK